MIVDEIGAGIIIALISGLCVAIPTIVATIKTNTAHDQVVDEKMKNMAEQLRDVDTKIDKYVSNVDALKERLVIVEQRAKSAHHRLDDITAQLKITEHRKE